MATIPPTFAAYQRDGRRVLTVSGDFEAVWTPRRLVSEFGAAAKSLTPRDELVVDLSGVVSFDPRALHALRRCALLADAFGLRWHVIVSSEIGRALDRAGAELGTLPIVRLLARA